MRSGLGKGNQVVTKLLPPSPRLRRHTASTDYALEPKQDADFYTGNIASTPELLPQKAQKAHDKGAAVGSSYASCWFCVLCASCGHSSAMSAEVPHQRDEGGFLPASNLTQLRTRTIHRRPVERNYGGQGTSKRTNLPLRDLCVASVPSVTKSFQCERPLRLSVFAIKSIPRTLTQDSAQ